MKLVIIGAGPAGEAAAHAARKKKAEVLLIEKDRVGGLCLNRGCIPSKTLLSFGKKIFDLKHSKAFKMFSLPSEQTLRNDFWQELKKEKNNVIETLRNQLTQAMKSAAVETIIGEAKFVSLKEIQIGAPGEKRTIGFDKAILAPGSAPHIPASMASVQNEILNSDAVLDLERVPESMVIVGGGAVGCEFACLFNELGSKITLIEMTDRLIPGEDRQIVAVLQKSFAARGIEVLTSQTVQNLHSEKNHWEVTLANGKTIQTDSVLVCTGRRPNCEHLGLEKAGIKHSVRGIEIDPYLRTSNPDVFAAGDATGLSLLAHAGSVQGELAVCNALGDPKIYDGSLVPRCLYTWPEVASVGPWADQVRSNGVDPKIQRFFFQGSGRALAEGAQEGFMQILSDKENGRILGAQIIGPHATELIHIISVAIKKQMSRQEVKEVIFAHPTFAEGIRAALDR